MKNIIFVTCLFLFCLSCDKECFSPPEPFRLIALHEDGTNIINESNQDSVKLFMVSYDGNIAINSNVLHYYDTEQDINIAYMNLRNCLGRVLKGKKVSF